MTEVRVIELPGYLDPKASSLSVHLFCAVVHLLPSIIKR